MDRAFLDANVLWSASYNTGGRVAQLWAIPDIVLLTSAYAIIETTRNIENDRHLRDLQGLLQFVTVVAPPQRPLNSAIILPEKDKPILQAAIECRATHLITGDRDFKAYFGSDVEGVRVIRTVDFLARHGK